MNYSVDWLPDAEQELADLWLLATDREAVTKASYLIDQRLGTDPENEGESRSDGRRILFVAPLGVIFRVRQNEWKVTVLHVWKYRTSV
jgi:hypothetical protein